MAIGNNIDVQQLFQNDPELRDSIANTTTSDPNQAVAQVTDIEHQKVTRTINKATDELVNSLPKLPVPVASVPQLPSVSNLTSSGIDKIKSLLPDPSNFIVIPTFFGSDIVAGIANEAVKKATDSAKKAATKAGQAAKDASDKSEARIQKATGILRDASLQGQIDEIRGTVNNISTQNN